MDDKDGSGCDCKFKKKIVRYCLLKEIVKN